MHNFLDLSQQLFFLLAKDVNMEPAEAKQRENRTFSEEFLE